MREINAPPKSPTPEYGTPAQLAAILQVSVKTICRWALEDPTMPVLRRGRVVHFHFGWLLAWLQRQEPRGARRAWRRRMAEPVTHATSVRP
jgi:hypothetical protein